MGEEKLSKETEIQCLLLTLEFRGKGRLVYWLNFGNLLNDNTNIFICLMDSIPLIHPELMAETINQSLIQFSFLLFDICEEEA